MGRCELSRTVALRGVEGAPQPPQLEQYYHQRHHMQHRHLLNPPLQRPPPPSPPPSAHARRIAGEKGGSSTTSARRRCPFGYGEAAQRLQALYPAVWKVGFGRRTDAFLCRVGRRSLSSVSVSSEPCSAAMARCRSSSGSPSCCIENTTHRPHQTVARLLCSARCAPLTCSGTTRVNKTQPWAVE